MRTLTLVLAFMVAASANIYAQEVEKPFSIKVNGKDIHSKPNYTGPTLFDFDKDGLQDLIVGTFSGNFRFYKNKGTKSTPVFKSFELIKAGGEDAKIRNW